MGVINALVSLEKEKDMIRRMMIESHIKVILIQDQAEVVEIIPEDIKEY